MTCRCVDHRVLILLRVEDVRVVSCGCILSCRLHNADRVRLSFPGVFAKLFLGALDLKVAVPDDAAFVSLDMAHQGRR